MGFSVGDKVVHPRFGAGSITALQNKKHAEGTTRYYVIDVPAQRLTVRVPVLTAAAAGLRYAMSRLGPSRVLSILRGRAHPLPDNYQHRQEQTAARLRTGRVTQLVRVVRDLTHHSRRARLTNVDSNYLRQGVELLAAEMALVTGQTIPETTKIIESALAAKPAA